MEPYAVTVVAAAPAPVPPTRRPPRLLLLALAGVVVVTAAVVVRVRLPEPPPALVTATSPASAADGWGPVYRDTRGRPARWDPCAPVHYVVQTGWAPRDGRRDLAAALDRISAASGLRFVDDGDTDELPRASRQAYQPHRYPHRWAPLLVAWVPPSSTDLGLEGQVQGVTLSVALPGLRGGSIVTAQVALDADAPLPAGFGPGTTDGEVLLHELAHAVGLRHVEDPTQVMWSQTTNAVSQLGAGDRAGLRALGSEAGCLPAPRPREVHTAGGGEGPAA
ncbi:MAG: peptidase and matrixin and adamalysin [Frankiales bacterium]|nr:peptidase and matrixin and adamalysin [Frankiales bacterium]